MLLALDCMPSYPCTTPPYGWVEHGASSQHDLSLSLPCSYSDKLLSIIRDHPSDVFMVFCNTVSSCDWASHFLQANSIPATKLHAGFRASVCYHARVHHTQTLRLHEAHAVCLQQSCVVCVVHGMRVAYTVVHCVGWCTAYTYSGFVLQSRKDLIQPFCEGQTRVLVCTDLASRGIHHEKVHQKMSQFLQWKKTVFLWPYR